MDTESNDDVFLDDLTNIVTENIPKNVDRCWCGEEIFADCTCSECRSSRSTTPLCAEHFFNDNHPRPSRIADNEVFKQPKRMQFATPSPLAREERPLSCSSRPFQMSFTPSPDTSRPSSAFSRPASLSVSRPASQSVSRPTSQSVSRPVLPIDSVPEIVPSQRNHPLRIVDGHRFRFIRLTKENLFEWKCNEKITCYCRMLSSTTLPYDPLPGSMNLEHDHTRPSTQEIEAMRIRYNIRRRASSSTLDPTSYIVTTSQNGFQIGTQDFLPSENSLIRSAQRHRAASATSSEVAATLVLFDSGPRNRSRIVIMGSRSFIDQLQRYRHLAGNGTFTSAPNGFYQLFTIHFIVEIFQNGQPRVKTMPALYCLLPDKLQRTYVRLFEQIQRLVPNLRPESFLADFESASRNAFRQIYPSAKINGCYFHLMQNLLKRVTV